MKNESVVWRCIAVCQTRATYNVRLDPLGQLVPQNHADSSKEDEVLEALLVRDLCPVGTGRRPELPESVETGGCFNR